MTLNIEYLRVDQLVAYKNNARRHSRYQIEQLAKSIQQFGFNVPILIDGNNTIIAGHGRLMAAKTMPDIETIPTIKLEHLSEDEKRAFILADNKVTDLASWDDEIIKQEIESIIETSPGIEVSGFDMDDFGHDILTTNELDNVEEPTEETKIQENDIILLGSHKVICADCTISDNVVKLLGDKTVDSLQTDPPYGVNYSDKNTFLNKYGKGNRIETPIIGDKPENIGVFFTLFLSNILFSSYNTIYCWGAGSTLLELQQAFRDVGIYQGAVLIWVKEKLVFGRPDYKMKNEFCLYGWKGRHKFYGKNNATTILEFASPHVNALHPTMKPIDIISQTIKDGSKKGALIYDPFLGSGTTLIASEILGRICYGFEIYPQYCQVIIDRYIKYKESAKDVYVIRNNKKMVYQDFIK